MRFATLWMHFPLAHRRKPTSNSLNALPPSTAPQTYHPKPSWHHHYNAICNSLKACPPSTSPQTHHQKPSWHHATLWMHFPLAQRRKTTSQSHLDTTITMRFATLWIHFPLAQRHKPTTPSHLDTTITMRFCNSLNACPPSTPPETHHPKPSWHHHYNAICNSLNALPPNTAPPSPSQHHLKPTITLRLTTCDCTSQRRTDPTIGDHRCTRRLTPPTFAHTHNLFYCKTQHFARNLTFRINFCVGKHRISCSLCDFTNSVTSRALWLH